MGKATKASRKFVSSGQLKRTIQARHKSQAIQKKVQGRKRSRDRKQRSGVNGAATGIENDDDDEDNETAEAAGLSSGTKGCVPSVSSSRLDSLPDSVKSVDDFLGGAFMEESDDESQVDGYDVIMSYAIRLLAGFSYFTGF